jgi:iron(III) transport system permease protein
LIGRAVARPAKLGWRAPAIRAEDWVFGATVAVVLFLVVPPVLALLRSSVMVGERAGREGVLSLAAYEEILSSPGLLNLAGGTLVFAAGSTLVGLLLGGSLAWLTARTNAPFKQLVYAGIFVSFAVPGILRTIGWIFLLGPRAGALNELYRTVFRTDGVLLDVFSLPAMVMIEGIFWVPLTFLMLSSSLQAMDPSLEEAAATSGASMLVTLRRITAHLALPSVLSVLILAFIRSTQAFEVPLLLGAPAKIYVLTTQVFLSTQAGVVPEYSYASAYGVLLLGFLVACIALYTRATRRASQFATVTGKGFRPRLLDLGPWRAVAGAFILGVVGLQFLPVAYLVVVSFLPTLGLDQPLWQQLTLRNYQAMASNPQIPLALGNSLAIGAATATIVVLLAAVVAWVTLRSRIPAARILDPLASLPLIFPGVVMGVAILSLYIRSPIPVYGTIWILVIAYSTSFLPFGLRYAHPGLLRIHPELEESAQASGAGWTSTFVHIVVPLLLPALFAGWIFVFLISLRELSAAALLYTARTPVIATTMLDLWQNGNVNQVSAFGTVVALVSIAIALVAYRSSRRWGLQA